MTLLEALKAKVQWPLGDNAFIAALTDRSLTYTDTYTGISEAFELAQADCLKSAATGPNVSEGGYSISSADRKLMLNMADTIYNKYGYATSAGPTAKFIQPF